jgi:hypothetical protein
VDDNVAGSIEAGLVSPIEGKTTEFSVKAHAMTPEKAKTFGTNRTGIGGSECGGR